MSDEEHLGDDVDAAHAEYIRNEHELFARGERDSYLDEITPWGPVEVSVDEAVVANAEAGGWMWQAESMGGRIHASIRLWHRMKDGYPFEGVDWGPPGYQTGPLDVRIRADIRKRMVVYQLCLDPNMVVLPDGVEFDFQEWLDASIPDEWIEP